MTGGGDEVRITVVDGIAERVEAQAWESLFEETSARLRVEWANGLSNNPAAPDDVRVGLLDVSRYQLYGARSTAVVEAAMAHPDWGTRVTLAEYQPNLTPEQGARLILAEEKPRRRTELVWAVGRRMELPATAYERLAADASALVREEVAHLGGLPVPVLKALAADSHASVRAAVCGGAWPHLDEREREALLNDDHGSVRCAALLRHHEDHPMPPSVFEEAEKGLQDRASQRCRPTRDLAERLVRDEDPARRRALARNPRLDPDLVLLLAGDPDDEVRFRASVHPGIDEEQRAGIDLDFGPWNRSHELDWVVALHDDADAVRRLAASTHPLVRRSVARARRLPSDVVERLARDEDRVVHLFLAESCEDAPAEMLLSVWRWWTGSLSHPGRPRSHPNFPRRDLLRYADDPSPRMRRLALDDPGSTPELVERFSRDTSDEVRERAAADPRLSAASAVRLLSDSRGGVRSTAARHPALPARVLVGLLRDQQTAENAARNPGVPADVMRRMLSQAREEGVV